MREFSTTSNDSGMSSASRSSVFFREMPATPRLLGVIQAMVSGSAGTQDVHRSMSVRVVQAAVRGFLQRRRYKNSRELHAVVDRSVELRSAGRRVHKDASSSLLAHFTSASRLAATDECSATFSSRARRTRRYAAVATVKNSTYSTAGLYCVAGYT